jgi:antitoxin PrlF
MRTSPTRRSARWSWDRDTYYNTYMGGFNGSITTTGKSEAIRLDKALFRLHPEFRQKAKVRAHVIAPGKALISVVDDTEPPTEEEDPVVMAFLAFIQKDMQAHPERIRPITKAQVARIRRLTKGVKVDDSYRLPDDVTF